MKKLILGLALAACAVGAAAQSAYTLTVPFAPGGASDALARMLARELNQELGAPVVVENKPGAGGSVAAAAFARVPKNSRHLFFGTISTHAINPSLYPDIQYDARTDFQPVALVATLSNMLTVNASSPFKTLADLVAEGRKRHLTYGSFGVGSTAHLAAEVMGMAMPELKLTHVPYGGAAPANTDLMGGQIDFLFDNIPSAVPRVQAGRLRGLAVTSAQRSPQAPDVPTMRESGFKDYVVDSWIGLWLPKGSDPAMVDGIGAALQKIYARPGFVQRIEAAGFTPSLKTGPTFTTFLQAEQNRWRDTIKALNISAR